METKIVEYAKTPLKNWTANGEFRDHGEYLDSSCSIQSEVKVTRRRAVCLYTGVIIGKSSLVCPQVAPELDGHLRRSLWKEKSK